MGQEDEAELRRKAFAGFTVDEELLARAAPDAVVLHCLPAHRGEEIRREVIDGPRSLRVAAGRQPDARHARAARVDRSARLPAGNGQGAGR